MSEIAAIDLHEGFVIRYLRGEVTVTRVQPFATDYGTKRIAVLYTTPKGQTLCTSFGTHEMVRVVN